MAAAEEKRPPLAEGGTDCTLKKTLFEIAIVAVGVLLAIWLIRLGNQALTARWQKRHGLHWGLKLKRTGCDWPQSSRSLHRAYLTLEEKPLLVRNSWLKAPIPVGRSASRERSMRNESSGTAGIGFEERKPSRRCSEQLLCGGSWTLGADDLRLNSAELMFTDRSHHASGGGRPQSTSAPQVT
jgi:hypothetical protein